MTRGTRGTRTKSLIHRVMTRAPHHYQTVTSLAQLFFPGSRAPGCLGGSSSAGKQGSPRPVAAQGSCPEKPGPPGCSSASPGGWSSSRSPGPGSCPVSPSRNQHSECFLGQQPGRRDSCSLCLTGLFGVSSPTTVMLVALSNLSSSCAHTHAETHACMPLVCAYLLGADGGTSVYVHCSARHTLSSVHLTPSLTELLGFMSVCHTAQ